jgi:hypothetical protein
MINEALDYHQNMNSVVFKRQAKNLEVYNNPSGKTDPSQGDILVDGTIKQRVSEIAASIQKLNQTITYASSTQLVGSAKSKATIKQQQRAKANRKKLATQRTDLISKTETESEAAKSESDTEDYLQGLADFISQIEYPEELASNPFAPLDPNYYFKPTSGVAVEPEPEPVFVPKRRVRVQKAPSVVSESSSSSNEPGLTSFEYYDKPKEGRVGVSYDEPDTLSQPSVHGDQSRPQLLTSYGIPIEYLPPLRPGEGPVIQQDETEVAPGPVSVIAPSGKLSSKIKMLIDDSLAKIVSSFNNLIEFIDFQVRQRKFTQNNEQDASASCKELLPSLKLLIANAGGMADKDDVQSMMDYTRIFNVISEIISKIESSPPFLKVNPSILSEPLPIRRDIIQNKDFDAVKIKNYTYLQTLINRLDTLAKQNDRFQPLNNPIEIEAKRLKSQEINTLREEIHRAGFITSTEALKVIDQRINQLTEEQSRLASKEDLKGILSKKESINKQLESEMIASMREENYNRRLDEDMAKLKDEKEALREQYWVNIEPRKKEFEGALQQTIEELDRIKHEREFTVQKLVNLSTNRHTVANNLERMMKLYTKTSNYKEKGVLAEKIEEATNRLNFYNSKFDEEEDNITEADQEIERLTRIGDEQSQAVESISKTLGSVEADFFIKKAQRQALKRTPRLSRSKHDAEALAEAYSKEDEKQEAAERGVARRKEIQKEIKKEVEKSKFHRVNKDKQGKGKPHGDSAELEPYLTKYLRPSKYRNDPRPVIESSSDEEPTKVTNRRGGGVALSPLGAGKKAKKLREDYEIIETEIHPDKAVLVEKKLKSKRIGHGKMIEATKPVHTTAPSQDLWFL